MIQIDSTLIAGVITALATLLAALIAISATRKTNSKLKDAEKYSIFDKTYTVLVRISDNRTIVIKDGFSWGGFFFSVLWLFYARLWEVIFTVFLVFGGVFIHIYFIDLINKSCFLDYYIDTVKIILLCSGLILGLFGNRLLVRKYAHSFCLLDNRIYIPVAAVIATTKSNAILKYMESKKNG